MSKEMQGIMILLRKPYRLCFVLFALFLFFAGTSYHSSLIMTDYIETVGEVCNVEETTELRHGNVEPRYNYDLIWYADGEEYEKHFDKQFDAREEGETTIWVRPDNKDAVFSNSMENYDSAGRFLGLSFVAGLIGLIFYGLERMNRNESRSETIDRLENTQIYSAIGFALCIIGIMIQVIMEYPAYKRGKYINPVIFDFSVACGVIGVGCILMFIYAKRKLKKYEW